MRRLREGASDRISRIRHRHRCRSPYDVPSIGQTRLEHEPSAGPELVPGQSGPGLITAPAPGKKARSPCGETSDLTASKDLSRLRAKPTNGVACLSVDASASGRADRPWAKVPSSGRCAPHEKGQPVAGDAAIDTTRTRTGQVATVVALSPGPKRWLASNDNCPSGTHSENFRDDAISSAICKGALPASACCALTKASCVAPVDITSSFSPALGKTVTPSASG